MRGAFISLEGVEGVGKSTNLSFTADVVRRAGHDVVTTREPGGTELGERIREWILGGAHGSLSAEVEALLMFAARARHLDEVIRPALESGRWVICDRFTDATFAYQGGGRNLGRKLLDTLKAEIEKGTEPDLTLLLDAPLDVGASRIESRKLDHFEREQRPFFERVRAAYLELAARHPARIKVVDASAPLEDVQRQISSHVAALLDRFGAARR